MKLDLPELNPEFAKLDAQERYDVMTALRGPDRLEDAPDKQWCVVLRHWLFMRSRRVLSQRSAGLTARFASRDLNAHAVWAEIYEEIEAREKPTSTPGSNHYRSHVLRAVRAIRDLYPPEPLLPDDPPKGVPASLWVVCVENNGKMCLYRDSVRIAGHVARLVLSPRGPLAREAHHNKPHLGAYPIGRPLTWIAFYDDDDQECAWPILSWYDPDKITLQEAVREVSNCGKVPIRL